MKKAWVLSYPLPTLISLGAQSLHCFCHKAAQIAVKNLINFGEWDFPACEIRFCYKFYSSEFMKRDESVYFILRVYAVSFFPRSSCQCIMHKILLPISCNVWWCYGYDKSDIVWLCNESGVSVLQLWSNRRWVKCIHFKYRVLQFHILLKTSNRKEIQTFRPASSIKLYKQKAKRTALSQQLVKKAFINKANKKSKTNRRQTNNHN